MEIQKDLDHEVEKKLTDPQIGITLDLDNSNLNKFIESSDIQSDTQENNNCPISSTKAIAHREAHCINNVESSLEKLSQSHQGFTLVDIAERCEEEIFMTEEFLNEQNYDY